MRQAETRLPGAEYRVNWQANSYRASKPSRLPPASPLHQMLRILLDVSWLGSFRSIDTQQVFSELRFRWESPRKLPRPFSGCRPIFSGKCLF